MRNYNTEKFPAAEVMLLSSISRKTTRIQNIRGISKFRDTEAEVQVEDHVIQRDTNWVGITILLKLHARKKNGDDFNAKKSGKLNEWHDSRKWTELRNKL